MKEIRWASMPLTLKITSMLLQYPRGFGLVETLLQFVYRLACWHLSVMVSLATRASWTRKSLLQMQWGGVTFSGGSAVAGSRLVVPSVAFFGLVWFGLVQSRYLFRGSWIFFPPLYGCRNKQEGGWVLWSKVDEKEYVVVLIQQEEIPFEMLTGQ